MCLPSAIIASLLAIYAHASITDCSKGLSLFTITKLSIDPPSTVGVGQNVSLDLHYTSPETIYNGTVVTSVTYNFIPFSPDTTLLCSSTPCPISSGDNDGSSWYIFPSGISGTVATKIIWYDSSNRQLLCLSITMKASGVKENITKWLTLVHS